MSEPLVGPDAAEVEKPGPAFDGGGAGAEGDAAGGGAAAEPDAALEDAAFAAVELEQPAGEAAGAVGDPVETGDDAALADAAPAAVVLDESEAAAGAGATDSAAAGAAGGAVPPPVSSLSGGTDENGTSDAEPVDNSAAGAETAGAETSSPAVPKRTAKRKPKPAAAPAEPDAAEPAAEPAADAAPAVESEPAPETDPADLADTQVADTQDAATLEAQLLAAAPEEAIEDSGLPDLTDDATFEAALESVLLVVDSPIAEDQLSSALEQPVKRIKAGLRTLSTRYTESGSGIDLRRAGDGWRFYTRDRFAPFVEKLLLDGQRAKLTRAALETLAVIAYRQPVTRARIAAVRGVNVDGVIRTLVARGLIEETGTDSDTGGILYRTTELFLERLGLSSLGDLPPIAPLLPEVDAIDDV
ncbi:SMC-Scp complex subunit ScpB [Lentzea sp. NPDC059081]|uniref:SMC-Scp complex subunit ScpB n=1 Tax=Lentzea sp. NPDC059081 TaxID=3346719 RepID=UPI0036B10B39